MALLEVKNLSISFGGLKAVDGFHIDIEKGQLYGLIGRTERERLPCLTFLQAFISQMREVLCWTAKISQEKAPSRSIRRVLQEHSRTSAYLRICLCLTM